MSDQQTYTLNQIEGLLKAGLIKIPANNILAPKPEMPYSSDISNQNSGGLCMEGKVVKRRKRFAIDFRRKQIGGYITRDDRGEVFDCKARAIRTLEKIRALVDDDAFDLDLYKKSSIREWRFDSRFSEYLKIGCDKKENTWAPSYKQKLKQYYKKYYLPFFKQTDLRILTKDHFKKFYHQEALSHLSIKTKKNIINALQTFFNTHDELWKKQIRFPNPTPDEPKWSWITVEDQLKILAEIPDCHKPIFQFLFWHGTRPGEARALQWDCVHWKEETVTIKRTFSFYQLGKTKSKKERVIPIYSEFLPILKQLHRERDLRTNFVFLNKFNQKGLHYGENGLPNIWNLAVKRAGLPYIQLYHGTRHSCASQLLDAGGDIHDIKNLLGHSKIEMTERYAHRTNNRLVKLVNLHDRKKGLRRVK